MHRYVLTSTYDIYVGHHVDVECIQTSAIVVEKYKRNEDLTLSSDYSIKYERSTEIENLDYETTNVVHEEAMMNGVYY